MRYRLLGRTGLRVSELCRGAVVSRGPARELGRDARGRRRDREAAKLSERNLVIANAVKEIAETRGASASQVAIARVRAQQWRAVTIPIVGVRTETQIVDNLAAIDIDLDPAELDCLDEASRVTLGFPSDFGGASLACGNTFELIEDHRRPIDPLV